MNHEIFLKKLVGYYGKLDIGMRDPVIEIVTEILENQLEYVLKRIFIDHPKGYGFPGVCEINKAHEYVKSELKYKREKLPKWEPLQLEGPVASKEQIDSFFADLINKFRDKCKISGNKTP